MPLLNFRDPGNLKEAIRRAAFKAGHSNSSKMIIDALEANPLIAAELKHLPVPKKSKK